MGGGWISGSAGLASLYAVLLAGVQNDVRVYRWRLDLLTELYPRTGILKFVLDFTRILFAVAVSTMLNVLI